MDYKVDWLSLSIIPYHQEENCEQFYKLLLKFLNLDFYQDNFKKVYGGLRYSYAMTYKNITIKIPDYFTSDTTGFGIVFSGQGIDFYEEYMRKALPDYTIVDFISAFFSLAETGMYKCNCSRIDLAVDDISYEEKKYYKLDLGRIKRALEKHEFTSPWAIKKEYDRFMVTLVNSEKSKLIDTPFNGKTLYLGSRRADTFCRIYDKLAKLQGDKKEYDKDIKHWTRMEFEFKHNRATSVCMELIARSHDDFGRFFSEVINDYIRFVVVKNKDDISHLCRCPSKAWWVSFVGTVKKSKLVHRKPETNQYIQSKSWLKKSVYPTLYSIAQVESLDVIITDMVQCGIEHPTQKSDTIINDFMECKDIVSEPVGFERYKNYTDNYEQLLVELRKKQVKNEIKYILNGFEQAEINTYLTSVDDMSADELLQYCDYRQVGIFANDIRSEDIAFHDHLKEYRSNVS